jgi:hypothetical protein
VRAAEAVLLLADDLSLRCGKARSQYEQFALELKIGDGIYFKMDGFGDVVLINFLGKVTDHLILNCGGSMKALLLLASFLSFSAFAQESLILPASKTAAQVKLKQLRLDVEIAVCSVSLLNISENNQCGLIARFTNDIRFCKSKGRS